jgi:predicted CopG family antitoxin
MASKNRNGKSGAQTIEIDREAYQRLAEAQAEGETISEVIKRCVRPPRPAEDVLRMMRRAAVSPATLQSIDESASRRRRTAHQSKS